MSIIAVAGVSGQVVNNPAYGLVSHETLKIARVFFGSDETVIELTVENRTPGGFFCVDRNTFLILPGGLRIRMVRSENIPNCPDVHKFQSVGEVLGFRLIFPPTDAIPPWFDLIEECTDNCFSVLGITTDSRLNDEIEKGYRLAEEGQPADAGRQFRTVLEGIESSGHGITASLYSNVVIMFLREGNEQEARIWYDRMIASRAPSVDKYIANLSARGIKW